MAINNPPRIIYAGDRDISVWVLDYLISRGIKPLALLVSDEKKASHALELTKLCPHLPNEHIFYGKAFAAGEALRTLQQLKPDFIVSIHFPYIYPSDCLNIPKTGVLNLHPAYLPYNRGWHTPSWAILDNSLYGATLHFMDEGLDTGDIVHQKQIEIFPNDTAHSLYQRVKQLELDVFKEAWPVIESGVYPRKKQDKNQGTAHKKKDLDPMRKISLDQTTKIGDLIRLLRGLTTNNAQEAAYFTFGGQTYSVQVQIQQSKNEPQV